MSSLIDLTGKKFGRLTVIEKVGSDKYKNITWLCKCECGKEKVISGPKLRNGNTKSCGCLRKEYERSGIASRLPLGLASMRGVLSDYKVSAKRRKLEFNLTEEQFKELIQQNCYYCGSKPNNISKRFNCNGSYIYNGLDRIDNTKGYTIDNVVSCCRFCNMAKNNHTIQEFKEWIKKVYKNLYI